jgi:Fur family ferric uptake transcriptional regulator
MEPIVIIANQLQKMIYLQLMIDQQSTLERLLRQNGYSVTKQRLRVFELLTDQEPITMYELYERAKLGCDRASLYRIITLFEKLGIVRRINLGWKYKIELSDKFAQHHHHLTCLRCHKIIPINETDLERFITKLSSSNGFRPIDHQVEIQGYCRDCSKHK